MLPLYSPDQHVSDYLYKYFKYKLDKYNLHAESLEEI